ncbi:MAG TPA: hypothetical protein VG733_08095, partial [Chthoniobacteraceae bacterium]|nr:hypothetical protein [Chthoniobacteraceae bacterium]
MRRILNIFCFICLGAVSSLAQEPVTPAAPAAPEATITPAPSPASTQGPAVTPAPSPASTSAPAATPGEEIKAAKAEPVSDEEVMTRLQIFLDQQMFGPGKIDGRGKLFTAQALDRYRQAHGLPINGKIDKDIPLDSVYPIFTTYTIKEDDKKFVGD